MSRMFSVQDGLHRLVVAISVLLAVILTSALAMKIGRAHV